MSTIDFAAVKARIAALYPDQSPDSGDKTPTPLWVYLEIVNKANTECYINYMQGARDLFNWLAPIDFQLALYPEALDPAVKTPELLGSYYMNELVKILAARSRYVSFDEWLACSNVIHKAIYYTTIYSRHRIKTI